MTSDTQQSRISLNEQIERLQVKLMNDRHLAEHHAVAFKDSLHKSITSTPVKIGAGVVGLLVARGLWKRLKPSPVRRRERRVTFDRRAGKTESKLTLKNVITVATTSLAVLEKLKRKDAEADKKIAEAEKDTMRYEGTYDEEIGNRPFH